jgi:TatA/E family protein of Tat protein translocase
MNEWIIVGIIAFLVLIVGAKKLPELARGVGSTRREFKRGLEDDEE